MRIFSERSPVPMRDLRADDAAACSSARFFSRRRERRIAMALTRFCCWERSSCIATIIPVGRCVIRTAESVVLTPWPPCPPER